MSIYFAKMLLVIFSLLYSGAYVPGRITYQRRANLITDETKNAPMAGLHACRSGLARLTEGVQVNNLMRLVDCFPCQPVK